MVETVKILLIEDNPGDARLIQEMLAAQGQGSLEIETVTRLADALARLGREETDVVLLDLGLPDSQGLDTFIRASYQYPRVPFVVLTGMADEAMGVTAVSEGAQDYLIKGEVDGKVLLRAIRYATERKRVQEALRKAHDELEQRVEDRTADLARAVDKLQEEIERRTQAERALQIAHDNLELKVAMRTAELTLANRELQSEMEERRRVEKAMEAERQRLFAVLDNLPVFVYLKAPDYTIKFANRIFRETFGPPGGKRCYEAITGREESCQDCRSFETLQTNNPQEWEWHWQEGNRIYQIYDHPFTDIDGSSLILTLGIDITARKHAENKLRESARNLRHLASQLLTAQEKERKRISRDLHDVLGQSLLSLKLEARALEKKLEQDPHPQQIRAGFNRLHSHLDGLIDTVRRLSRDLSPYILEDLGISAALRHLFDNFKRHDPAVRFSLEIDKIDELFGLEKQINIYRIFQEALTNIGKYAQAAQVTVVVGRREDEVFFLVEDNGRGFDVVQAMTADVTGRGLGLASMQERVRMLGGEMEIWSEKGKGTRISFIMPRSNLPKKPACAS